MTIAEATWLYLGGQLLLGLAAVGLLLWIKCGPRRPHFDADQRDREPQLCRGEAAGKGMHRRLERLLALIKKR